MPGKFIPRTKKTTRSPSEVEQRLNTLDANSPPEEKGMLEWMLRQRGYPAWRHEVRKLVNAEVKVRNATVRSNNVSLEGGTAVATDGTAIDLNEILSIENPDSSPGILSQMEAPEGHCAIPSLEDMKKSFERNNYFISDEDAFTIHQCMLSGRALLVSGPPGVGKTELAKQIAIAMGLDIGNKHHFSDLFCTPDISVGEALYRWNDAKRLLDLQLLNSVLGSYRDRIDGEQIMDLYRSVAVNAYSLRYLEIMPLLRACLIPFRTCRLVDEIDKTYPTFDNLLLDLVSKFAFEVPEYGTIGEPQVNPVGNSTKPIYVLVSNGTRDLSAMLVSRCVTLWLNYLPENLEAKVIKAKLKMETGHAQQIAAFFRRIRELATQRDSGLRLRHPPSTREVIATASGLMANKMECTFSNLFRLNSYWVKNLLDYDSIRAKFAPKDEWVNAL